MTLGVAQLPPCVFVVALTIQPLNHDFYCVASCGGLTMLLPMSPVMSQTTLHFQSRSKLRTVRHPRACHMSLRVVCKKHC